MPLKPYEEFAPGPLVFPIGGKTYTVPEVDWQHGLKIRELLNEPSKASAEEQNRMFLGDAYDQMVADNVPPLAVSRAALTAYTDYSLGREIAEQVWESGLSPEALAPKGAKAEPTQPSSTGEASETPTPASTSGTSSRPASSKTRAKRPNK